MKLLGSIFGQLQPPASAPQHAASTERTESDDEALIQQQLAEAQREAQNALAEWRSYSTPYYEAAWIEAVAKVQRLEATLPKRKAASAG